MSHMSATKADDEKDYRMELYKSLRSEAVSYIEKVPALWLQKFVLVGGVITFLLTNRLQLTPTNSVGIPISSVSAFFVGAVLLIPLLAALLDAKIMEYTLHARAISLFIADKYPTPHVLSEWENCLWGDTEGFGPARMTKLRSALTVLVTVVPTSALILVSGVVLAEVSGPGLFWIGTMGFLSLAYLALAVVAWCMIWPRKKEKASR